ncbi:MAG: TerC family protein, partial [Moraxellaceae bacterium]|nr:TerC family protein [Moraxellaceae bacterium]
METLASPLLWIAFILSVLIALAIDFVGLNKSGQQTVSFKSAAIWSLVWFSLALAFGGLLWWETANNLGSAVAAEKAAEYFTGYLVEKSLAVDNVFVFLMIFSYFALPIHLQRRVLLYGILGAIILRAVMIFVGGWLLTEFHWLMYVFGAFLVLMGVKMWQGADDDANLEDNKLLKWLKSHIPLAKDYDGEKFFTLENGKRVATPLFLVLVFVELSDVIFAVDSIPAIFAITSDPFIVLTSNIYAILGLRAMYFMLAGVADKFSLLNYGLAIVLVFIGTKMLLLDVFKIPALVSLAVIVSVLAVTMWLSFHKA